ncbi:Tox-REase-5 domain-containing protein [Stenotrophomonas sp.]|uniref:Tox-REase-5 domain-containing protein n=1 Tax=Stenotrophomonas sp. TaxID=69392 RepID=UPI0028A68D4E|nr:Tox-REase-5 domain-containing protein [Stenotrophomonas sp.]
MAATPAPAVGKVLELLGKAAAAAAAAMGIKETVKDRPGTRAREADCSEVSDDADCDQCLLINGRIGPPPTPRYIAKSNRINYDYQLYVANLHAGPERFGYVRAGDNSNSIVNIELSMLKDFFGTGGKYTTLEWIFGGIAFDGFWRSKCTVIETKANYGHVFNDDGTYKKKFMQPEIDRWVEQFRAQSLAMEPTKPSGKLEWHFMQEICYVVGVEIGIPVVNARLTPLPALR